MVSADGQRHYRIELSIPRASPSNNGYPVLYMLDGNSAMATLTARDFASIAGDNAPVLVAIGYDIDGRLDVDARSYDYTPPVMDNGKPVTAPTVGGRVGGGADIFLDLLTTQIKPLVQARANIDLTRESLWGHSYGGLFVVHTLLTQPDTFDRYITGDPSAWWHDGAVMQAWEAFDKQLAVNKQVAILVGTRMRASRQAAARGSHRGEYLRSASKQIADGLHGAGADVSYEEFSEYGHGQMSLVSLQRALRIATAP